MKKKNHQSTVKKKKDEGGQSFGWVTVLNVVEKTVCVEFENNDKLFLTKIGSEQILSELDESITRQV